MSNSADAPDIVPDYDDSVSCGARLHKFFYPASSWAPKAPNHRRGEQGTQDFARLVAAGKGVVGRLEDNVVMVDCDSNADSTALMSVLRHLGLHEQVPVMDTSRGKHAYFRNDGSILRNASHVRLACGIIADIKIGAMNGYDCIAPHGGATRYILNNLAPADCPPEGLLLDLPVALQPIPFGEGLAGLPVGSRNDTVMKEMGLLKRAGYDWDDCREILDAMNECVFSQPLGRREFDLVTRKELYDNAYGPAPKNKNKPGIEIDTDSMPGTEENVSLLEALRGRDNPFQEKSKGKKSKDFDHTAIARELVQQHHFILIGGRPMFFDNGIYVHADENTMHRLIDQAKPDSTINERREVAAKICVVAPERDIRESDKYLEYYVFNNGTFRLNLDAAIMEPVDVDPERLIFNRIDVDYDKDASDPDLDKFLNDISCGNTHTLTQIAEMIGLCLLRRNIIRGIFMLLGNKRNGKSTFLELLVYTLGSENVSSLKLHSVNAKFSTWQIANKLANIGDDISHEMVTDTNTLKSIATSDPIVVERKNKDPYTIIPYCTMIFSVNEKPKLHDTTNAALDRINIIPFQAYFDPASAEYDPSLILRLKRPSVARALIAIAVRALSSVLLRGALTDTPVKRALARDYAISNNHVLEFVVQMFPDKDFVEEIAEAGQGLLLPPGDLGRATGGTIDNLVDFTRDEVYTEYKKFCRIEQYSPLGKTTFNKELLKVVDNLTCRTASIDGVRASRYFPKDESRPVRIADI